MASRDVVVNLPRLDQIVPPAARKQLLVQLALLEAGRIKRRTKAGLDADGKPFAPYSTEYRENRERAGWSTKPDLWLRGGMLNSIGILEADADRVLLGFQGSAPRTRFAAMTRLKDGGHFVGKVAVPTSRKNKKTGGRIDLVVKEAPGTVANALKAFWNMHGRRPRRFFAVSSEDRVFLARHALRELLRIAGQVTFMRAIPRR